MFLNKKCNKKNILIYCLPAFIVLVIILLIFLIKGFYPFGNISVLQIDADYNYVPLLYKIYDIFHYGDSFLWDFKIGGGANLYSSLVFNSIYFPLNWLVIFCKRSDIRYFFNILLIIKFMFMSTTMFFFIRKNFKNVDLFWQIILSLIYVFSGWTYLMFSNIFFIDVVILFPIVMHFLIKLFKENKCLGLILSLGYCLCLNFYLSYMIYLFIIFSSFIAIFLFIKKEERKKKILNLCFSLIFSLLISAFSYLPLIFQILSSARTSDIGYESYFFYFFLKTIYVTMSSFIIVTFIKYLRKNIKSKKGVFYSILVFLTSIGIIVEPINRAWHIGSYKSFPYRYSFILIFILICSCLEHFSDKTLAKTKSNNRNVFFVVMACLFGIVMFLCNFNSIIEQEMISFDIARPGVFVVLILLFFLVCICYSKILIIDNLKLKKIICALFVFFEIIVYSNYVFNDYGYVLTERLEWYNENFNIDDNQLYKYVDYQGGLSVNGSYITRNATLSNWVHIIPKKQLNFIEKLGYSSQSTLIYGYGGTIFSDALIGVKYAYSYLELPSEIFKYNNDVKYDDDTNVYFYDYKYDSSFGFLFKDKIDVPDYSSMLDEQNYFYRKFFDVEDDIIKKYDFEFLDTSLKEYKFRIDNKSKGILYLNVDDDLLKSGIEKLYINDEIIGIGSSKKIVYVGKYDENINVKIKMIDDKDTEFKGIQFGFIDLDDYKKMIKKIQLKYNDFDFYKNKLHINLDSDRDQYLFLPINNIAGWSAKVNSEVVNIDDVMYTFMGIKVNKGNNDIELEFQPPYLKEGIYISGFGALLLVIYSIFKKKIIDNKILQNIAFYSYCFVSIVLFIIVYIVSNFIFI